MIYFDNAATSYPTPKCVIDELNFCLKKSSGNAGRSGHKLSYAAAEAIYLTRERIAEHFCSHLPERVVFTYNATYAINTALRAMLTKSGHVLISDIEHNSVIRPLELLKKERAIEYSFFSTEGDLYTELKSKIKKETYAIVSSIASNVTGKRISLEILSKIAKENSLLLIVDASQAAGHEKIDLSKTPCDCLCAPGHKGLFGIQGVGFMIFSENAVTDPFIVGGSGTNSKSLFMPSDLPEALEAGTLSAPSIVSLKSGIEYIDSRGIQFINEYESRLGFEIREILGNMKKITLYDSFGGIVLFNVNGVSDSKICAELDRRNICVRGGLHCAPQAHKKLGTDETGAVRISLSCLNTRKEVCKFAKELRNILAEI